MNHLHAFMGTGSDMGVAIGGSVFTASKMPAYRIHTHKDSFARVLVCVHKCASMCMCVRVRCMSECVCVRVCVCGRGMHVCMCV